MITIYVGNLPYSYNEDNVRQLFEPYGEILNIHVIKDRDTGRSRGFCFVDMKEKKDGMGAINALNGKDVDGRGRALRVNEAKERESRGAGGGGGGGGGFNRAYRR